MLGDGLLCSTLPTSKKSVVLSSYFSLADSFAFGTGCFSSDNTLLLQKIFCFLLAAGQTEQRNEIKHHI